jgi:hypothetical protein
MIIARFPDLFGYRFFKGKAPYAITKVGMTVLVHGMASELKESVVCTYSLDHITPNHLKHVSKFSLYLCCFIASINHLTTLNSFNRQ